MESLAKPGFPEDACWNELWDICGKIEEADVRHCFAEAIWCTRIGGYRAAVVIGWVAISLYFRRVYERLPESVREGYRSKFASPQGRLYDRTLLKICGKLSLFDLRDGAPTETDTRLKAFLELRDHCAHSANKHITHDAVIDFLRYCGKSFVVRPVATLTFGEWSIVRTLAKADYVATSLPPEAATAVIEFVTKKETPQLATALLSDYLTHSETAIQDQVTWSAEQVDATQDVDKSMQEWHKVDVNLANLWVAAYQKLTTSRKEKQLKKLVTEFAERVYSYARSIGDGFELINRGEGKPQAEGCRTLGDLSKLLVWKNGMAPPIYKNLFYTCFEKNPEELRSLSESERQDICQHAPTQEMQHHLQEALR